MKLTVLTENTTCRDDLMAEHGLSLYLEAAGKKILMDMGQTDVFAQNAEKLGIDLTQVDFAVVSHGHYDHGGGLQTFLQINRTAPVYIHETAFGAHYNGTQKYIGLDGKLQYHSRLLPVRGELTITPEISLHDCNELGWIFPSWGLNRKTPDGFTAEAFTHEHYLQIMDGEKRIVLSGCSHKGIDNIVRKFCPDVLIGGFHLNKLEDTNVLREISQTLLEKAGICYTGHCTGAQQFETLKAMMGSRLQSLTTGMTIII